MSGVASEVGERHVLSLVFGQEVVEDLWLKLYVNNRTPMREDRPGSYREMSTHGYQPKRIPSAAWKIDRTGSPVQAIGPQQTWLFESGDPVLPYGWFTLGATSGDLYYAERFRPGLPRPVELEGDVIRVTPVVVVQCPQE